MTAYASVLSSIKIKHTKVLDMLNNIMHNESAAKFAQFRKINFDLIAYKYKHNV